MDINLINYDFKIINNISNKEPINLNLSFDLDYDFQSCNLKTKATIYYTITLYDNNKKFGILNADYEFLLDENIHIITLNEETKKKTLNSCLKSNHTNIFNLIKQELNKNNILFNQVS